MGLCIETDQLRHPWPSSTGDQCPAGIDGAVQADVDGHQLPLGSVERRRYRLSLRRSQLSSLFTTIVSNSPIIFPPTTALLTSLSLPALSPAQRLPALRPHPRWVTPLHPLLHRPPRRLPLSAAPARSPLQRRSQAHPHTRLAAEGSSALGGPGECRSAGGEGWAGAGIRGRDNVRPAREVHWGREQQ